MKKYVTWGDLERLVQPEIDKWLEERRQTLLWKIDMAIKGHKILEKAMKEHGDIKKV